VIPLLMIGGLAIGYASRAAVEYVAGRWARRLMRRAIRRYRKRYRWDSIAITYENGKDVRTWLYICEGRIMQGNELAAQSAESVGRIAIRCLNGAKRKAERKAQQEARK
jgi:hypothetical protein